MGETVNMHQEKTSLSRLVERALAGEELVIARNGEPLVKLVPVPKERKPRGARALEGSNLDRPGF
jgi:prevent-host-death family protein